MAKANAKTKKARGEAAAGTTRRAVIRSIVEEPWQQFPDHGINCPPLISITCPVT